MYDCRAPVEIGGCPKGSSLWHCWVSHVSSFSLFCGLLNITLLPVSGMGIFVTFLLLRALTETSQKQNNSNVIVVIGFFQGVAFHVELMLLR